MPPVLTKLIVNLAEYQERMVYTLFPVRLLWPDFVLVDDLLLRKDALPDDWETFQQSANDAGWLPHQIEYVVNHVHMEDLIWDYPYFEGVGKDAEDYLATTLAEMWRAKIQLQFPDRAMVVGVDELGNLPVVYAHRKP